MTKSQFGTGLNPEEAQRFAERLARARTHAGWSRHALAKAAGCDASYLTRIEHGDRAVPSKTLLLALIEAMRLSQLETNELLILAGYAPVGLKAWDPCLESVINVLFDTRISEEEVALFKATLSAIALRWRPLVPAPLREGAPEPLPVHGGFPHVATLERYALRENLRRG